MADDDLNIDLDIGSNELEPSLRRTAQAMESMLQRATQTRVQFDRIVEDLRAAEGLAKISTGKVLEDKLRLQQQYNSEIRAELDLQKQLALGEQAGRARLGAGRVGDGRAVADVRLTEKALSDAVAGINTTADQITARIALAVGKAQERLLGATAQAIENSYLSAIVRQDARSAQFAVPGYLDSRVVNARVRAEQSVAQAAMGSTLAERQAGRRDYADALLENRRRDQDYRAVQAGLYSDAAYEDRQRTLARNRERRDAERENAERDRAAADAAKGTYAQAAEENRVRDVNWRRMRAQADWDNRNFDLRQKAADAEYKSVQTKIYSDAVYEDRQRTLARNRERRDAERENAERNAAEALRRNPNAALRGVVSDESFQRRTGLDPAAFRQRIIDEQLTTSQQAQILREARASMSAQTAAGRPAPLSAEQQRAQRVQGAVEFRNDLFSANGGADMLTFQAKLAANYAIFGLVTTAIKGSVGAIVEFDENLKQFQAITDTSNAEMGKFRENLLGLAVDSKFSVNELTKVAIALGQTGLSAEGVTKALKPVADLAAASGASLQESVEAITAVLGAFNMEAGRAGEVADVFVAALNRTKLTMGQLQLGIQYAANIARDSGISFSELTASIGAMSQAGVKSGSTIGTGIRQLITELSSPTDKLRGVLKELGISLEEVDLRTEGFTVVLENLRAKGFGTSEALRSLDLRAAAAFSALAGQADKVKLLQQEFLLSSAAGEAAAKANESFSASGQRLVNVLFGMVDRGFHPLVTILAQATGGTATLLKGLSETGAALPIIASGLAALAAAAAAIKATSLIGGLLSMAGGGLLAGPLLPVAGGIAAAGGLAYYLMTIQTEAEKAREKIDQLKGTQNELLSRQSTLQTAGTDIDGRIQNLTDRRAQLLDDKMLTRTAVMEAQKAFAEFGLTIDANSANVDDLIKALQNLRGEMAKELPQILSQQILATGQQIDQLEKLQKIEEARRKNEGRGFTNLAEVAQGGEPVYAQGRMAEYAALGPDFAEAAAYLSGARQIDRTDALGSTSALRSRIGQQSIQLQMARSAARLDTSMSEADRSDIIARLDARLKIVNEVLDAFNAKVKETTELQGLNLRQVRENRDLQGAEVRASDGFKASNDAFNRLYGQQDLAIRAARRSPTDSRFEAMQAAARSTDDLVREQLAIIEQAKKDAIADGTTKEAADDAYRSLIDSFNGLLKGSTKEIRDQFQAEAPEIRARLQQSIRTNETQLQLIQRQASTGRDPARVAEYEALAKSIQEEINAARDRLFKVDQGVNAEQIIAGSTDLTAKREELREQGAAKIAQLGITYAEIHRKLQDQMLSFQVEGENERKGLIEAQIKGLEKVRDDVRSTPEQMRAAVLEINRLLGEVAKIGRNLNTLNADREALKVPQGQLPPSVNFDAGSVQQRIVDSLKASGASEDRIRYALASGQIESGFDLNARNKSGATGLYQFMPNTWNKIYGTRDVSTDFMAQLKAFQEFTDRNAGTFQSNMGRAASPDELYLMHQQGAAGAMALMRAGSGSALDALTGVYGNASTAGRAITGNGGRTDMTADEFIALITRKFRSAENEVGNPFGTTGDAEVKRRRQVADDKVAQDEEDAKVQNQRRKEAADRAAELARLKKLDVAESETYDAQTAAVKRAITPEDVLTANNAAMESLRKLYDLANAEAANKPDRMGVEEAREAQEARRKQFSATAQNQAISASDAVGRSTLKSYTDQIDRLEAELKELQRPENAAKEGNADRINVLNKEIETLTKRKELEGQSQAVNAQILVLEQELAKIQEMGLGSSEKQLVIQARLAELRERQKVLGPLTEVAGQQARKENTYLGATQLGVDDFLKQRGLKDQYGDFVADTILFRKSISEVLTGVSASFDSLWTNIVSGSMSAGEALKKFATDILGNVMSAISKSLTNDIMKAIFGGSSGGSGLLSGLADGLGSATGFSFLGFANGGLMRMAGGGGVTGSDAALANRDSKLILGAPGEYMLRKSAVDAIGRDTLDEVNALGGRMISRAPKTTPISGSSSSAMANVYLVPPEQVPPPSRNDVVHWIGEDIQRDGSIKQLIKRVAAGG